MIRIPISIAAFIIPALAGTCATCPSTTSNVVTSLDGANSTTTTYYLVNRSNSGPGTPTYCGSVIFHDFTSLNRILTLNYLYRYNTDASHPWPEYYCFYSVSITCLWLLALKTHFVL
jgi:hypothetical protein